MEDTAQLIACALCGGRAAPWCVKNGFSLYRCAACGHGVVQPLPQDTAGVYGAEYFAGASGGHGYVNYDADKEPMRPFFNRALGEAEALLGPGRRRLLDVGAATGFFLSMARARGWQAAGVELSDFAAGLARRKGLDVRTGALQDAGFEPESFDLVALWDVIEHVRDPAEEMRQVHALLSPGGLVVLTTPDASSWYARLLGARWHALVPPEHLHYFTRQSMALLLQKSGFELIEMRAPVKSFTLGYIFQMFARWQGLSLWRSLAAFIKQYPSLARLPFPIPLRDNMYVIAHKI